MTQRQFCRTGIHSAVPAVTLTFDNGARLLHWCAEHATDADAYRPDSDQRDEDIRYALADDLERMGLWPNEDRELELEAYEPRPSDWHIDTP